ncbi:MAG: flavin reductase family protein [Myxococcales bacterium]|nr:MAG: flavin reductase family protein [Myxococcales bacterium]
MQIDPEKISQPDRYKLCIGSVVPRPIAFVSSQSASGESNLAPYSFFTGVSSNPLTLLFCPANKKDGSKKDTLLNVETTREFVVNIVSEEFQYEMAACAEELPRGESEFKLSGLEASPSIKVKCPRVARCKMAFECKLEQVIELNPGAVAGGNIVIGRVVWIHADDDLINERFHVDQKKLAAVGRMGGLNYCSTKDIFEIPWGKKALEKHSTTDKVK